VGSHGVQKDKKGIPPSGFPHEVGEEKKQDSHNLKHLILGFSAAGANAAETIRRLDDSADITVVSADPREFYLRLDLEGIFHGKSAAELMPRPPEYWREKNIVVLHEQAAGVDAARREVTTAAGHVLPYDRLLIATGALPRKLNVPGENLDGVVTYHTLDDAERIFARRERVKEIVIVGGGILGLELARAAVGFGWKVTILVRGNYVGSPTVDPSGSPIVARALEHAGVTVLLREQVASFEGEHGRLTRVTTTQGRALKADLAAVCIGGNPSIGFLQGTNILTDGKLIVDDYFRAPVEDVYAAGDAAVVRVPGHRDVPCRTWTVASAQARAAAANMCGQNAQYREDVLYNLDHLFDQEFSMIGAWEARHEPGRTIHELPCADCYRALVVRDGILESALLLGKREGDRRLRKLIARRARVEGKIERVLDPAAREEEFV